MGSELRLSVFLVAVVSVAVQRCRAVPQSQFYLHGAPASQSQVLQRSNGPGPSYQTLQLSQEARFYNQTYSNLTVSSNGVIVFGDQTSNLESQQEPFTAPLLTAPVLAPFWAQARYLSSQTQGTVRYAVTRDSTLLQRARQEITAAYTGVGLSAGTVSPVELVVVTWTDVRSAADQSAGNTFQCVVAIDASATYAFFLYADGLMAWSGSPPALVGFSAEGGLDDFILPTSLTPQVLHVTETGNMVVNDRRVLGRWIFRVDSSSIDMPGTLIGLTETQRTVLEDVGEVSLCLRVLAGRDLSRQVELTPTAINNSTMRNRVADFVNLFVSPRVGPGSVGTEGCTSITIVSDSSYEENEDFAVEFSVAAGFGTDSAVDIVVLPKRVEIAILDDDSIQVNYVPQTETESSGLVRVCAEAQGTRAGCFIEKQPFVQYRTLEGTAIDGVDYYGRNGTIAIPISGRCTSRGCADIRLEDDEIFEPMERFSYTLTSNNSRVIVDSTQSSQDIIIMDDDAGRLLIGLTETSFRVSEGGEVRVCIQWLEGRTSHPVEVRVRTGHISAITGRNAATQQDLIYLDEQLTFEPSRLNETLCRTIVTLRDDLYEGTEVIGIVISNTDGVRLAPNQAVLEVMDTNHVEVSMPARYDSRESQQAVEVCANLTGHIQRNVIITTTLIEGTAERFNYQDRRDGDVFEEIPDIVFTVPASESSRNCFPYCTACTTVTITDDNTVEEEFEDCRIALSHSDTTGVLFVTNSTRLVIQDDDVIRVTILGSPLLNAGIAETSLEVPEICMRQEGRIDIPLRVQILPRSQGATVNEDFVPNANEVTFFPSPLLSTTKCSGISVTILDDLVVEGNETIELVAVSGDSRVTVDSQAMSIAIVDDDNVGVRFVADSLNVTEEEEGVEVCVELVGYTALPLSVILSSRPETALVGTDFVSQDVTMAIPVTNQSVLEAMYSLPVPQRLNHTLPVSPPICTTVSIVNDGILEQEQIKTFALNLSHPDPAVFFLRPFLASVSVLDDDSVTIMVDAGSAHVSVTEGEAVRVCARMLGMADFPISASFQPRPVADSAVEGVDYVSSEQLVEFPALREGLQCVEVQSREDTVVETDELFEVELSITGHHQHNPNIALGTSSVVTVTILDNDFVEVGFESAEYSIVESEGEVMVCVQLTGLLDIPVSIEFSVMDPPGRDQGAPDYIPIPSIPLFVNMSSAASRMECVSIAIANDSILENTESFEVSLSSADSTVRFTQQTSTVYIIDDDGVRVGLRDRVLTVPEEAGQAIPMCVDVVGQFQRNIEVTLETRAGSAQAGSDYIPELRALTFTPASAMLQEICINVSVIDDNRFEDAESFVVFLHVAEDVRSVVSIHIAESSITILDEDQVRLSLPEENRTLTESAGEVQLCVQLTGLTEKTIPYLLEVVPLEGTSESDFHFTAAAQSQFLPASTAQQTQCHTLLVVDDVILENTEHLQAILTPPVGVARLQVGVTRMGVAIIDDDSVRVGFTRTAHVVDEDGTADARTLSVCVELTGEIEREVSVTATSRPGTANAEDFAAVSESITFTPGPSFERTQCFNVFVHEDREVERRESFSLALSSSSEGVMLEPRTADITITDTDVVCLVTSLDTSRGFFSWPETYPGEVAGTDCENGTSLRRCSMLGEWEKPDTSSCYISTNGLFRYIERHGFSMDNFKELLFAINQLVRESEKPTPKYVKIVDQILRELQDKVEQDLVRVDSELFNILLEIMNGVQEWPQETLMESSSSIVNSFEAIAPGFVESNSLTNSFSRNMKTFAFSATKREVTELFPREQVDLRYTFIKNEDDQIVISSEEGRLGSYQASVTFPNSLAEQLSGSSEAGLVLSYYINPVMFPYAEANKTEEEVEVTPVVSASFVGHHLTNLKDSVVIKLRVEGSYEEVSCVSWSFSANDGAGNWVEDGCELVGVESGEATCACSHLTNFACLVVRNSSGTPTDAAVAKPVGTLSLISIVGVCTSILALALTILTLLVFGKMRRRDNTKLRIQLCLSMIFMLVFFVTGIYQVETFEICVLASGLLHYFTLVTAMWLAADALLMILKLNLIFPRPSTRFIVIISLLCWLLPVPFVVVPIAIDTDFAVNDEYCFIDHTPVFFGSLLGPIAVLLAFILVTFSVGGCCILRYSTRRYKDSKKAAKRRGACRSIFSNLGVMVLFGVTWVFGAFTIREQGPQFFKYLFVGFNSLQGLFVFFFFVVFAKQTSDLWLQSCGCKERKKRKTLISAITGIVPPKKQKMSLDANAERLRPMEEIDPEARLGTNSWDITFVMAKNQFGRVPSEEQPVRAGGSFEEDAKLEDDSPRLGVSVAPSTLYHSVTTPTEALCQRQDSARQQKMGSTHQPKSEGVEHSPSHSIDSARMSTADSGILMEGRGRNSPSPPLYQHPQSGSTPKHVHSVSGIGYVSAESSMETLPQREEDCYISKGQKITLAPSLRPRAIPNEYSRVDMDNMCA